MRMLVNGETHLIPPISSATCQRLTQMSGRKRIIELPLDLAFLSNSDQKLTTSDNNAGSKEMNGRAIAFVFPVVRRKKQVHWPLKSDNE